LDFVSFTMAHTPLKMTIDEAHAELNYSWAQAYSPEAIAQAVSALDDDHVGDRVSIFLSRLCFRGIYFPMMSLVAARRSREPPNNPEVGQRWTVSMGTPTKFLQRGYSLRSSVQYERGSARLKISTAGVSRRNAFVGATSV